MKAEETIDFPIRWAWHKIARLYNNEAIAHGFTMSIGYALLNIDRNEGTPSTKLGPLMGMESCSLTRTLKNMEERGYITRKPDSVDRRSVRICLTPAGEELRRISRDTVIRFNRLLHDCLSDEERNTFFSTMSKINNALDQAETIPQTKKSNA